MVEAMHCPECGSSKIYKDGLRYTNEGQTQRYLCRVCGRRFSKPNIKVNVVSEINEILNPGSDLAESAVRDADLSIKEIPQGSAFSIGKDVGSHDATIIGKALNSFCSYSSNRQLCASKKAKKLGPQQKTDVAGEESHAKQDAKGKLVEFSFYMQKEGMAKPTISTFTSLLKKLGENGANLLDPESVKEVLAKLTTPTSSKATIKGAYGCFLKFIGKSWKPPKYTHQQKIPFIPLESEIDALIAGCGKKTSAALQLIKETGMRIGEAERIKWTDMNPENNSIILNEPEKHGNPRMFKVSPKLISILQVLPKKHETILGTVNARNKQHAFKVQRNKLAQKLGNPRLARITFHTLRHWKGTMEYHKTHDPDHVKRLLGHRSLQSTEIYINTEQAVFNETNEEFHVKVANSLEEACKLLEVGFEYITDMEGKKLFRKRR